VRLDGLLPFAPLLLAIGAVGMLSPLRVPRLGRTRSRALDVVLVVTVAFGYGAGLFHRLPEYMLAGGLVYLAACVVYHWRTRR
jgi:Ca2+/Na+ antiporter